VALKQTERLLSLTTPLGPDVLVLTAFAGREEMSRLFSFQLEMISDNNAITAADIVGKNVTWTIKLNDESPRFFNGFVSRFYAGDEEQGRRNYRAEVVPWPWFLGRTADCRIFQNKTVKEIIEQVFGDLGFSDFETGLV
jgi:type VI secretion system secreted protein VgrG